MDPVPEASILIIIFLTLINSFFSAAEMAIGSLNKNKIKALVDNGDENALIIQKLLEEPKKFISTIHINETLCKFLSGAVAAIGVASHYSFLLENIKIPYSKEISMVIITVLLSYLTLVFGEFVPKRIAVQNSEKVAMMSIKPILFLLKLTSPYVKVLSVSTSLVARLLNINTANLEQQVSKEEIKSLIEAGKENGLINETEQEMIESIFEFDDKLAKEVMTPRTESFLLDISLAPKKVSNQLIREKYSRIPVYENDTDNIIGILYMKDFYQEANDVGFENVNIRKILRQPYFVPETKNIDELFKELKYNKQHIAILVDEYGGFSGIITIEDLIEEVMGNILDEYDDEMDTSIKKIDKNTYVVDGYVSVDDVNEELNLNLESLKTDSIAGLLLSILGKIPETAEEKIVEFGNITFRVEKASNKRIEKVKICIQEEC